MKASCDVTIFERHLQSSYPAIANKVKCEEYGNTKKNDYSRTKKAFYMKYKIVFIIFKDFRQVL